MSKNITYGQPPRGERPAQLPSELETHESAEIHVSLRDPDSLIITVSTRSGFASAPRIVLQQANGTRVSAPQTKARKDDDGQMMYATIFQIEEPYIDALVDVRGMATSGLVASAVEGLVLVRYEEPGTYKLFGPRGAVAIRVVVDRQTSPDAVWIGPAPRDLLQHNRDLTPVSEAFTVGSVNEDRFQSQVNLAVSARLDNLGPNRPDQLDIAIYRWEGEDEAWSRLDDSSGLNPTRPFVKVDIEQTGIYALFVKKPQMNAEELRRENDKLRRLIVDQEQELQILRMHLDQFRDRLLDLVTAVQPDPKYYSILDVPGDADTEGW